MPVLEFLTASADRKTLTTPKLLQKCLRNYWVRKRAAARRSDKTRRQAVSPAPHLSRSSDPPASPPTGRQEPSGAPRPCLHLHSRPPGRRAAHEPSSRASALPRPRRLGCGRPCPELRFQRGCQARAFSPGVLRGALSQRALAPRSLGTLARESGLAVLHTLLCLSAQRPIHIRSVSARIVCPQAPKRSRHRGHNREP